MDAATPATPVQPVAEPIQVASTSGPGQLAVALRQLALTLAPIATYYGATHAAVLLGQAAVVVGPAIAVVTIAMGQFHERHTNAKLVTMEPYVPNAVAQVVDSRILK